MPEEHGIVMFSSPEQAARHHASAIGATSRGGWIFAADGARLTRGWTAYAEALQQDGVILLDGESYRLASATTPAIAEVPADASAPSPPGTAPIAAAPAPELTEAGHATARALLADPEMVRALDAQDDRAMEAATLRVTGMALEAPVVVVLLRLHLDTERPASRAGLASPSAPSPAPSAKGRAHASPSTLIAGVETDTLLTTPSAEAPAHASLSARRTISTGTASAPRRGRLRLQTPATQVPSDLDLVAIVQEADPPGASLRQICASVWSDLPWSGGTGGDSATGRLRTWPGPAPGTGPSKATAASWLGDRLDSLVHSGTLRRGLPRHDEVDPIAGQVYLVGRPPEAPVPAPLPLAPAGRFDEQAQQPGSTFPSPELAARHHATAIGATSTGDWITAADGAFLAPGWTSYARVLLQDEVILRDGEGYRLASPNLLRRRVLQAKQGDRGALQGLIERYQGMVYGLARRLLRDPEQARDVTQDVLLRVCQSLETLSDPERVRAWLNTITVNLCRDQLRRTRRRSLHESFDELGWRVDVILARRPLRYWSWSDPARVLLRKEIRQHLVAALAKLTEKQRTPLLLHELEDLTYEEIAERLGCPPGTIMSRLYGARQAMQRRLRDRGVEGAGYAA